MPLSLSALTLYPMINRPQTFFMPSRNLSATLVVWILLWCVLAPFLATAEQPSNDGFEITHVDGHPLSGSLADEVYNGYLPKNICHQSIVEAEKQQNIPKDLLMAIAFTEAGRWQGAGQPALIWPWSLTVNGKGHFYETPELAIHAAETFSAHGIKNIDIGCMQINFQYHRHAFSSVAEMFDPIYNAAYAAYFLQSLKNDLKTWSSAVEGYHSRTPEVGIPYGKKVFARWDELKKTRREEHRQTIAETVEQQKQQQIIENAQQAQVRAQQQMLREERMKAIEGTEAAEWKRPQNYKQQQRAEAMARARVLTQTEEAAQGSTNQGLTNQGLTNQGLPNFEHPSENEQVIYHTLRDNETINTSKQWLLQKFDEWEHPTQENQTSEHLP